MEKGLGSLLLLSLLFLLFLFLFRDNASRHPKTIVFLKVVILMDITAD